MDYHTTGPRKQDSLITAEQSRNMFDSIAGYYDGANRILSLGLDGLWRKNGVARLDPKPGGRYLDVGCGTGDIALEILRRCPGSSVKGIDPSVEMLALGKEKVEKAGLGQAISLNEGDAMDMVFEDDSFDGAIASFCLRNVPDRRRALREIRRVVREGGRLVILELTEPRGPIMRPLFRLYSRVVMPLVTKVMSSVSAYRYLADSMADFPAPQSFMEILEETGFENPDFVHMTGGIITLFWAHAPAGDAGGSAVN